MMQLFDKMITNQDVKHIDIANIKDLLESLVNKDTTLFSNKKAIKTFPFSKDSFITGYLSFLEKQFDVYYNDIKAYFQNVSIREEVFECEVGDKNWYIRYLFDINKAERLIKEYNLPINSIDTSIVAEFSNIIETNKSYVESSTTKDNRPIIVCHYPHSYPNFFVIDGNHRVMRNYKNNIHSTDAYLVSEDLMLDFLISPFFKHLVNIHSNISFIGAYMIGDISYKDLLLRLKPIINLKY